MAESIFQSNLSDTAARVAELDRYMATNVLDGMTFVCDKYDACRASHAGQFFEGQLHHVGRHYDLVVDGKSFRIVVVGQEYGNGPRYVSREARSRDVAELTGVGKRFFSDGGHPARNPHMRGTTSLLRLLFGRAPGRDYSGEFLSLNGTSVHIFELGDGRTPRTRLAQAATRPAGYLYRLTDDFGQAAG